MKLYLLDSNDAANYPAHRGITSELYGGGRERVAMVRVRQLVGAINSYAYCAEVPTARPATD